MLYPTKIALSSDRKRIYILDSGNYRIRMIDLQTETMTMVLDTRSWPINNFHLDEFDNLYANNRRTIRLFKRIPSKTTNLNANQTISAFAVVSICLSLLILAFVAFYFISSKQRSKNAAQKLGINGYFKRF